MNTENQKKKKIFIGLDIGTGSIGAALTDENYVVPQKCGKPLMLVRLFDEAQPATDRRVFRSSKVRSKRKRFRITLLQELLAKKIEDVDPLFYIRLQSSGLWLDDKRKANEGLNTTNSLFADNEYGDKQYFKQFETIYHLRKYLCDEKNWADQKPDIRLVYLACHHILKSRGHFLYESDSLSMESSDNFSTEQIGKQLIEALIDYLNQENENSDLASATLFTTKNFEDVISIIKNDKLFKRDRIKQLTEALCPNGLIKSDLSRADAMIKAMVGSSVRCNDILGTDDDDNKIKVCFSEGFEKQEPDLIDYLDEEIALIYILKNIYDWIMLVEILKGASSISASMIEISNKHHEQLLALKQLIKEKGKKGSYFKIFRSTKENNNYAAYIGSNLSNGKSIIKKCDQEDFYKFLKKELGGLITEDIERDITNHQYLQKLRTKNNAIFPYQLHKAELSKILNLAVKYELIDEDTSSKINSIMTFRVPYFVGRLNPYYKQFPDDKAHHVWIEKRINGVKITPWNFNEVVDLKESNKNFITRMLSQCSHLHNEKVLPKDSLVYQKFAVLNELNNLRIHDERISVVDKQRIFNELFKTQKRVSLSAVVKLLGNGIEKEDIRGIDVKKGVFNASYSSYIEAKKVFGDEIEKSEVQALFEDVILWHTLHTDKSLVVESIKEKYPQLDENIIKKLKSLNFSGFGSLSKAFLTRPMVKDKETEVVSSIVKILWNTKLNLSELEHDQAYNVQEWLANENYNENSDVDYSNVRDSYASPSVKRSVWQAMRVVDELVQLNGGTQPDKIFVEVTRSNSQEKGDKGRTKTRRKRLEELFSSIKLLNSQIKEELDGIPDDKLRGEKIYLYFLQCGKCAYSGQPISLNELLYDNQNYKYDVDHIIPQSLKKDDSQTNKVLVQKNLNSAKDNYYPLNKVSAIWDNKDRLLLLWRDWNKNNLISDEKLSRLTRTTPITEDELKGFIARQLVSTSQSATVVAELLKQKYKNTEIVYVKAENVSAFRDKFDYLKCRDANDLHHAHDAYLNIVVGNTYNQRFNHNKSFYVSKYENTNDSWRTYSLNHIFEYSVEGAFKAGQWKNGKQLEKGETEKTVEKHLSLTYLPVSKKTQEGKGAFYDQTVYSAGVHQKDILSGKKSKDDVEATNLIYRKGEKSPLNNVEKYGGYKSRKPAFFMIIEYADKKGMRQREFTAINILDLKHWNKLTPNQREEELSQKYGTKITIVEPKILIGTLFKLYGMDCRIAGWNQKQMQFHNAKQMFVDKQSSDYMRIIAKYNKAVKDKKMTPQDYAECSAITISGNANKMQTEYSLTKGENLNLWTMILHKIKRLYGGGDNPMHGGKVALHGMYDRLYQYQDKFLNLPIYRQINVLNALIIGMGCNASSFDLSEFGDGKSIAKIQTNVKINYPLTIVRQSITGIKETKKQIFPF